LVRGLSVLFWGAPIALVVGIQTAKGDWFRPLGVVPPMVAAALLCYAVHLLTHFQIQERIWRTSLERTQAVALINLGLAPFLYWWSRIPSHPFFSLGVQALTISGLLFLFLLNPLLVRLTAMLPDETLRVETRFFASLNGFILGGSMIAVSGYFVMLLLDPGMPDRLLGWLLKISPLPPQANVVIYFIDRVGALLLLFFTLPPLAMTMALVWKIKEVILASVFGQPREPKNES
jgi:hypothetical protein